MSLYGESASELIREIFRANKQYKAITQNKNIYYNTNNNLSDKSSIISNNNNKSNNNTGSTTATSTTTTTTNNNNNEMSLSISPLSLYNEILINHIIREINELYEYLYEARQKMINNDNTIKHEILAAAQVHATIIMRNKRCNNK